MVRNKLTLVIEELKSFSKAERIFAICAMFVGFMISAEYAVIRPVANSLFISTYSTDLLPTAWLMAVPLSFIVVALYNRYLAKLGCWKMFLISVSIIILGNIACALFCEQIKPLTFAFYVWKEVYVMLMFQQLWSLIHSMIKMDKAKYLYGIFFAVGGVGGVIGSSFPSFFAVKLGSESLIYLTIPIYLLATALFYMLVKHAPKEIEPRKVLNTSVKESLKLITTSRTVTFILLIVIFMQLSSGLVDFQFNTILEKTILDKDLRTEYWGRVYGIINIFTIGMQLFGTFLLVHYLGLKMIHAVVPFILSLNAFGFLLFPQFGMISFSYVTIKSFDFSIFGVIKEMLYVPLKPDEKFRAKAIIDVFAHRAAKAFSSIVIIFFQAFFSKNVFQCITWTTISIFFLWILVISGMFRKESLQEI